MKVVRFEDLIAWQKSRELSKLTHEVTSKSPLSKNYPIKDQMTRASLSVMSNIAEGLIEEETKSLYSIYMFRKDLVRS